MRGGNPIIQYQHEAPANEASVSRWFQEHPLAGASCWQASASSFTACKTGGDRGRARLRLSRTRHVGSGTGSGAASSLRPSRERLLFFFPSSPCVPESIAATGATQRFPRRYPSMKSRLAIAEHPLRFSVRFTAREQAVQQGQAGACPSITASAPICERSVLVNTSRLPDRKVEDASGFPPRQSTSE
ncbi:MAG: hypothetical protein KatS3mg111_3121 [Pirellulaceae bacterium]|nr:MAG: hypothetical protein KatS3mg111_3121 [Pirellulaceae bacterium]